MKILYHHRVASKDGQYVHIAEIVASLRKQGHEVILCEPASIQKTQFGKGSGLVKTLRSCLPGFFHELAEFFYSLPDFFKMRGLIKKHEPDCIYERYNLYFVSGIWSSKRYKIPLLLEVNAPLYEERSANEGIVLGPLAKWSERYCWRGADRVLPVTQVLADMVGTAGVAEDKLTVIPNGINSEFTSGLPPAAAVRSKYGLGDRLVLGFIGFVREWHRLDKVLEVIAQNTDSDWHLFLVGDGPDRARLEAMARKLGIEESITITGVVSREAVPGLMQCFDIALQPDVVPYASPLKLFEYMALGKPVLAPDTANLREILTNEDNALLFGAEEGDFERQLLRLCDNNELRSRIGERAEETIVRRDLYWDANARKIVELFEELGVQSMIPVTDIDASKG